jgi:tetratricopeptide (TPR) repeat protein
MTELVYARSDSGPTERQAYMLRRANLNAATASMETNDGPDCLKRYKQWLGEYAEQEVDPNDTTFEYERACIYNETGVAYAMNGDYQTAVSYFLTSIDRFQRLPDYEDIMLNWPEPNLGFMYWVQGKYDDAERVLLEILQIHEDKWGVDDRETFKYVYVDEL